MFRPLPLTDEFCPEVYKALTEPFECTEEDAKVKFTDDQLKELCLKHKCRVMASRWNMADDFCCWLREDGRFKGKKEKHQRRMIAKGVSRYKDRISYDEKEIQETRNNEWRARKKESILSLRYWEHQRQKKDNQPDVMPNSVETTENVVSSIGINTDLLHDFEINTESFSVSHIDTLTRSQDILTEEFENEIVGTSTQTGISYIANQLMSQSLSQDISPKKR